MKIISACLLGIKCRYDGRCIPYVKAIEATKNEDFIPVCPEQLGGLPTPRESSEIVNNKVLSKTGRDLCANFVKGAQEVLIIARLYSIKEAVLKQRSPSCGCGQIYDGTFSGKVIRGDGITTRILKNSGINVISEDEL